MNNPTWVKFNDEAKKDIKAGIDLVADAVKSTLGPKGRTVIIDETLKPHVTKDGVTVARSIEMEHVFKNIGARLIKEASETLLKKYGDGTTSVSLMTQNIINKGMDMLESGSNPIKLKKMLEQDCKTVLEKLESYNNPCSEEAMIQVATVSANNDAELGGIIADTINKIGYDGVMVVEESKNVNTTVKIINGMELERGYLAPHFVTDTERNEVVMENPRIMITNQKLMNVQSIIDILEPLAKAKTPILLIAEEFEPEVIENLKYNKIQGTILAVPLQAPSFGDYRKQLLEDLAILTGGQYLDYEDSRTMADITMDMLGSCDKIIIDKDHTIIMGGHGDKAKVDERIVQIRDLYNRALDSELDTNFTKDFLRRRIAKLTGGVATLYVGGKTEMEMKERKDRADDAIAAATAAQSGVVLGGGVTYLRLADELPEGSLLHDALKVPLRQILTNGGLNDVAIEAAIKSSNYKQIFNADTEEFEDSEKTCIFDPYLVVKGVIETAVSISTLFLTTDCIIAEKPLMIR